MSSEAGIAVSEAPTADKPNILKDRYICIAGYFEKYLPLFIYKTVKEAGGKIVYDIRLANLLIHGLLAKRSIDIADELGIEIWDEEKFYTQIGMK